MRKGFPPIQTPFAVPEGFTYLGIKIIPTVNKIVPGNYKPLSDSVTDLLDNTPYFFFKLVMLIY